MFQKPGILNFLSEFGFDVFAVDLCIIYGMITKGEKGKK